MPAPKKKAQLAGMIEGGSEVVGGVDLEDNSVSIEEDGFEVDPFEENQTETETRIAAQMNEETYPEHTEEPPVQPTPGLGNIGALIGGFDEDLEYQRWVVYGNNGTGKTSFLGTIPNVLVINPEHGTRSVADIKTGVQIPINTWGQVEELYWYLSRCQPAPGGGLLVPTAKGLVTVQTIAFDTVTRLMQLCLRSVVLGEREKDISKDIIKATQSDWGTAGQKVIYWLGAFKQLPVNTVWVCQERKGDSEVESDYGVMPDLPKSVRNFLCGDAEIIARTFIKQSDDGLLKYVVQFGTSDIYQTKDRSRRLPGIVANPKWVPLVKRINTPKEAE